MEVIKTLGINMTTARGFTMQINIKSLREFYLCIPIGSKSSISVVNFSIAMQNEDGPLELHIL